MMTITTLREPYPLQREAINADYPFKVVAAGHLAGKHFLAEYLLLNAMRERKACLLIVTDAYVPKSITWQRLRERFAVQDDIGSLSKPRTDNAVAILQGGGRVECFSGERLFYGDQQKALKGRHYDLALFFNAAFMRGLLGIWYDEVLPSLINRNGRAWFISTPNGVDRASKPNAFHRLALKSETDPNWATFRMPTSANPFAPSQQVARARRDMNETTFRRRMEAEFIE